jgi:hypothetical protein
MPASNVATNFDLLRWRYGTHKALQERLQKLLTWNQLSVYALGKNEPPQELLRKIEAELKLPNNWFERDNVAAMTAPQEAHLVLSSYLALTDRERKAVAGLLSALSAA